MSMSTAPVQLVQRRFGETVRRDVWWIKPLLVFLGLSTFSVYATWAALQGDHYSYGPESITITDNAIIPLKERVIDQLYDPIAKLFRVFRGAV